MYMGCSWFFNSYYDYYIFMFLFVILVGVFFVVVIEIKSIWEKVEDKVKKEFIDVVLFVVEIVKYKDMFVEVVKVIVDYFNGILKKE